MVAYFEGRHHPQQALAPRTGYVAEVDGEVVGYVAGHLTRRFGCDGEIQYLFVASALRRRGIARELLARLAEWFAGRGVSRVCVNVNLESPGARPFYLSLRATDINPYWMEWHDIRVLREAGQAPDARP